MRDGWYAGFFDGEGNIGIEKTGNSRVFVLYLRVGNTHRDALALFHQEYGGHLRFLRQRKGCKTLYIWEISKMVEVGPILRGWFPHLIVKRPQALLALEYIDYRNKHPRPHGRKRGYGCPYPQEVIDQLQIFYNGMRVLNKTGS